MEIDPYAKRAKIEVRTTGALQAEHMQLTVERDP